MHAVLVARASLRRRLTQPPALHAAAAPWPRGSAFALRAEPALASSVRLQQQRLLSTASDGAAPPKIAAAKALSARLRRKAATKNKVVVKVIKADGDVPVAVATTKPVVKAKHHPKSPVVKGKNPKAHPTHHTKKRTEEEALRRAAAAAQVDAAEAATEPVAETAPVTVSEEASEPIVVAETETTTTTTPPPPPPKQPTKEKKPSSKEASPEKSSASSSTAPVPATTTPAPTSPPAKRQNKASVKVEADTEKITMTLKEIEALQKQLPSVNEVASIVAKLRSQSFVQGQTLFDLYRIYGNPFLDENFLTPGVLACCKAKQPAQGIQIVRDMLEQGRKVDESTLRALMDVCDETSAAREIIQLWGLMTQAGVKLTLKDLNLLLEVCHRKEYLDGAIKVLKELRLHRSISVHNYMFWLHRATVVWRADAFFDLLMEMRLSGVEPEISSLTSLESGRKDRALTVMEGVRAVGLDPCFAMSSVYSSMQYSVYKNGPAAEAITPTVVAEAKEKFGDLQAIHLDWPTTPIPQVLETQAAGLILEQETFRRLKLSRVQHIDELLQMLPITTNMTINLRKQLQRMSLLVNTHRVKRIAGTISNEFQSGKSLIELSSIYNYPPVSLMRIILRERGLSPKGVQAALRTPAAHLSKREQNEIRKASGYDSIHRSDPFIGQAPYNADSLEDTIGHFLRSQGIRFKTEDELGDEQHAKYGRRVISPDILLLDPVIVNGTPIRWIDAKNYYGAHIVSKRLISRQLESYVKEWGPGAIVFGMGFSDMFSVPGVICLDTTPFPKTRSASAKMRTKSLVQWIASKFSWKKHLGSELTQEYPTEVVRHGSRAVRPTAAAASEAEEEDDDTLDEIDAVEAEQQHVQQQQNKRRKPAAKAKQPKETASE